jgi:hypothetical protein
MIQWNGLRFANVALRQKHEVKAFLMSAGVEVESIVDPKFNAKLQLDGFIVICSQKDQVVHRDPGREDENSAVSATMQLGFREHLARAGCDQLPSSSSRTSRLST